jgi:hypothetical protein
LPSPADVGTAAKSLCLSCFSGFNWAENAQKVPSFGDELVTSLPISPGVVQGQVVWRMNKNRASIFVHVDES